MKSKELVMGMKVKESLGYSDHEMMEFKILRGGSRDKKQDYSPGFQESRLCPLQSCSWKNPMSCGLEERRGPEELA